VPYIPANPQDIMAALPDSMRRNERPLIWVPSNVILRLSALWMVACVDIGTCGGHPRRLNLEHIDQADRVAVLWSHGIPIATITDPSKVQAARAFFLRHRDGWIEPWTGLRAGARELRFYQGDGKQAIADLDFSETYITSGGMYMKVPSKEITELATALGIPWPPG
jgi:hypothetical protein